MKVLIVEDESSIAFRIERMLQEILLEELDTIVIKQSLTSANDYLRTHEIDLLFLDLNLSGESGFDILEGLLAESFYTVIISAYRDRAIDAFEYGVIDFVAKPFDKKRLEKAIARIKDISSKSPKSAQKIPIKKNGMIKLIVVDDIVHIKGANVYSEIHSEENTKELSNKTLEHLEKILPNHFIRVHKSYIVNAQKIEKLSNYPGSKYELLMKDQSVIPVGRTRVKQLKELIT